MSLDQNLRLDMQIEVKRIQRHAGITTILVTHDQEEALSMADRIAVLSRGRLEQLGSPIEVYDTPQSLFVNAFVGACNLLPGRILEQSAAATTIALDCGAVLRARSPAGAISADGRIVACIRPEHLTIAECGDGLPGTVEMGLPLGAAVVHEVRLRNGSTLKIAEPRAAGGVPRLPGTEIAIAPRPEAVFVYPAPSSAQ